jgi:hypothetical protein
MLTLMRLGGVPMWFVLGLGLLSIAAAAGFVWRPAPRKVAAIRALSLATLGMIGAAICTAVAAVGHNVPARFADHPQIHLVLLQGLAESMSAGILGFGLVSITWMLTAVGHRRLGRLAPSDADPA